VKNEKETTTNAKWGVGGGGMTPKDTSSFGRAVDKPALESIDNAMLESKLHL